MPAVLEHDASDAGAIRIRFPKEQGVIRPLKYQCTCQCGQSKFTVTGRPLARLYCHCEICQALYRQARADVTIWLGHSVQLAENQRVEFKRYRLPPAINRGTCVSCGLPVVGFLRLAPFVQLAFVPAMNFPRGAALPRPSAHIFYHRRVKDARDRLPKISGYWPSELYATKLVLTGMLSARSGQA
jgi:hypothetical protein